MYYNISMLKIIISALFFIFISSCSNQIGTTFSGLKGIVGKERLSDDTIVKGIKEALRIGAKRAVKEVSKEDGYYKNPLIKITFPKKYEKLKSLLQTFGYSKEVESFEYSMNRAAQKAAPEALGIFVDAIREMTISDAKKILKGKDDEATIYLKEHTYNKIKERFMPVIETSLSEVDVTKSYQDLNAKLQAIPFANKLSFNLEEYVANNALKGLFTMLAEEEKKIRHDPKARATELLKKVFGSKN